ncbi:hypothetical protein RQP46_006246 [Phenoliferia psychrophenolica]
MLPVSSSELPPAPSSIASSLAPEILALIPTYLKPEERQRACHSMNLVSRSWYLATREDASFVVTRASQADALNARLQHEGRGSSVRDLNLVCAELGGFTEAHMLSFMGLLVECSALVSLDLSAGPRGETVDTTVWYEDECFNTHPIKEDVDQPIRPCFFSRPGGDPNAMQGVPFVPGQQPPYFHAFAGAFAMMLAPLSSLEDLQLPTLECRNLGYNVGQHAGSPIPKHWPAPSCAPLRRLAVGTGLDGGLSMPLVRWLLQGGPAVSSRSIDIGVILEVDALKKWCDILQPVTTATYFRPHLWWTGSDPTYTRAYEVLSTLQPITYLHLSLSNLDTEHEAIIKEVQSLPSLQHLLLHTTRDFPVDPIKDLLSQKTLLSFGLEWSATEGHGPVEENFEAIREAAAENARPSLAATLAAELLALVLSHLKPVEQQKARHAMNLVSRSWYLATRQDASYVVTRSSQAEALLSRLREERKAMRVRSLYFTCSESGYFFDSNMPSFMGLLAECSSLVALDLCIGGSRPTWNDDVTVWKETECYTSHPQRPRRVYIREGELPGMRDWDDYLDEFAAAFVESVPTFLKYFTLESGRVIDVDVMAR